MIARIFSKLSLLLIMFLPQYMIIILQIFKETNKAIDFPIESLTYSSTALAAVSFNNFFNIRHRTTSAVYIWLYLFGTIILLMSALSAAILFESKQLDAIIKTNYSTKMFVILTFISSIIFFLFSDYIFYKLENSSRKLISFQLDEAHKVDLNNLAKAFISFTKSLPKILIISILVTISLYIIFHYENNIVNHLGVLGGVIAVITMFNKKGEK